LDTRIALLRGVGILLTARIILQRGAVILLDAHSVLLHGAAILLRPRTILLHRRAVLLRHRAFRPLPRPMDATKRRSVRNCRAADGMGVAEGYPPPTAGTVIFPFQPLKCPIGRDRVARGHAAAQFCTPSAADRTMKRHATLLLFSCLTSLMTHAQSPLLWGMTSMGGEHGKGTLFRIHMDGTGFTVLHHFDAATGWDAEGTLCAAPNGKLYGTTVLGGSGAPAMGTLFSFDPVTDAYALLQNFDGTTGGNGFAGMVVGADGMLYGAGYLGSSGGTIYRVDPADDSYSNRFLLDAATDGSGINNRLCPATDGWFYGTASQGGSHQAGTLFRFNPADDSFENLHDFDGGLGGKFPLGSLSQADDGWFYGTTEEGGSLNKGTLFRYDAVTDAFEKLVDFDHMNGEAPWNCPVVAGPDLLFGTTAIGGSNGAGRVYRYVPSTNTLSGEFDCSVDFGGTLFGNVMLASDGELYGLGSFGGSAFGGVVYRVDPDTHTASSLHEFTGPADGSSPTGDLIETAAEITTGLPARDAAIGLQVYPNPAHGAVTVVVADPAHARLRIRNALGQLIHDGAVPAARSIVDLPAIPGTYALSVVNGGGSTTRWIVVE
jgi:uncharacterized repeat protein (TIGR03803 family)